MYYYHFTSITDVVCFIFYSEREAGFHIEHTVLTTNLFETGCLYAGSLKLRAGIICCSGYVFHCFHGNQIKVYFVAVKLFTIYL